MVNRINKRRLFEDLGYRPHPGQLAIHQSEAPRRVCACGVRWGKTVCAAMEAIAAALVPAKRTMGWIVAPTYDLADKVFREIQIVANEKLEHRVLAQKSGERRLMIRNLGGGVSEIRAKSADNPVSLLGEGLDFLVVDEASRLKPAIWEGHLSQRLIDKNGWALLISTPKGKGWFHELFRRGQDPDDSHHASWNSPSWSNPHLDAALIEAERARLPVRVFSQEFGGEFVEGAGQVFRGVRECATGSFQDPIEGERYMAGLDLAKIADYSVLVIMNRQREVVFVDRFHRIDWSLQVARIKATTDRFNHARVYTDTTGKGEPIFEALALAGVRVEPYIFTNKTKTDLINNLAVMIENGEIVLPRPGLWPVGIDELEAFEYSVSDSGTVRMNAPGGQHDDCVIGLALAAWGAKSHSGSPRIRWVANPRMGWM